MKVGLKNQPDLFFQEIYLELAALQAIEPIYYKFCRLFVHILKDQGLSNIKSQKSRIINKMGIARHGFEPRLQDPESRMIDHYTTGLR